MTDTIHPEPPAPAVRVWSPLAVAVYGLLLAYPASLVLAVKNWRALGLRDRILPHVAGAFLLTVPLVFLMIFSSTRAGRMFSLAMNVMTFVYLKEKLRSDLRDFTEAHPGVRVETRAWYSAFGWALLGLLIFVVMGGTAALIVAVIETVLEG